jgi:hypothetical protein
MAKRKNDLYDYVDEPNKSGGVTKTLRVKLYSPEGHVYHMPHGGDPAVYTSKRGYKTQPDAAWHKLNEAYEAAQVKSLKLSEFQREHKERLLKLEQEAETLKLEQTMAAQEEAMAEAEAELKAKRESFDDAPNPILDKKPKAPAKKKTKG